MRQAAEPNHSVKREPGGGAGSTQGVSGPQQVLDGSKRRGEIVGVVFVCGRLCGRFVERQEVIARIDKSIDEPRRRTVGALPEFLYENGYTLCISDLGKAGVKVELTDSHEGSAAVILPPDKTEECSKWLSQTLGQRYRLLPDELSKILGRLLKERKPSKILERGDKRTIKEALKLLKTPG